MAEHFSDLNEFCLSIAVKELRGISLAKVFARMVPQFEKHQTSITVTFAVTVPRAW